MLTDNCEQKECPICYEKFNNNLDVCTTLCRHKFHTSCLTSCKNPGVCPICRTNVTFNINKRTTTNKIPSGTYSVTEYRRLMETNGIPLGDLSPAVQYVINEDIEWEAQKKEYEAQKKEQEEKKKESLKTNDKNKYELLYRNGKRNETTIANQQSPFYDVALLIGQTFVSKERLKEVDSDKYNLLFGGRKNN